MGPAVLLRVGRRIGIPAGDGGIGLMVLDLTSEGLIGDVVEFPDALDHRLGVIDRGEDLSLEIQGETGRIEVLASFLERPTLAFSMRLVLLSGWWVAAGRLDSLSTPLGDVTL